MASHTRPRRANGRYRPPCRRKALPSNGKMGAQPDGCDRFWHILCLFRGQCCFGATCSCGVYYRFIQVFHLATPWPQGHDYMFQGNHHIVTASVPDKRCDHGDCLVTTSARLAGSNLMPLSVQYSPLGVQLRGSTASQGATSVTQFRLTCDVWQT